MRLCLHQPFSIPTFLSSLKSRSWKGWKETSWYAPNKPAPCTLLLFHFQKLLYRRAAVAEPACCHADLEDIVSCQGLVLPWSRLCGLFTHPGTSGFPGWESSGCSCPDAGNSCGCKGCCATAESAFYPPLPIKIRKAGVKSHFENLLLSVADALETTLLTRLIAKCKLIVCTGH